MGSQIQRGLAGRYERAAMRAAVVAGQGNANNLTCDLRSVHDLRFIVDSNSISVTFRVTFAHNSGLLAVFFAACIFVGTVRAQTPVATQPASKATSRLICRTVTCR